MTNLFEKYAEFLTTLQAKDDEKDVLNKIRKAGIEQIRPSNFSLENYLNKLQKPVVEIAGPTPQGFALLDTKKLRHLLVTNLAKPGQKVGDNQETGTWRDFVGSAGKIDVQADGQHLPFASESIAGVLASALLNDQTLNQKIIDEAKRVLVPEGILVLEANLPRDVLYALENGFVPVKWKRGISNFFEPYTNIALMKSKR